jgi:hypothetical protein
VTAAAGPAVLGLTLTNDVEPDQRPPRQANRVRLRRGAHSRADGGTMDLGIPGIEDAERGETTKDCLFEQH